MAGSVLLTGGAGFIGRAVLREFIKQHLPVTVLVRPGKARWLQLPPHCSVDEINFADHFALRRYCHNREFSAIVHIGAVRNRRQYSREEIYKANVGATELLAQFALDTGAKFIFCSSVGVFGAIPRELPAAEATPRVGDNTYHMTKIKAEEIVQNLVLKGLNAAVVRPSITYGPGDDGFPITLCRLVKKHYLVLPDVPVHIHLSYVNMLAQVFYKLLTTDFIPGSSYIAADSQPVELHELADFIHKQFYKSPWPTRTMPISWFNTAAKVADLLHQPAWRLKFKLISRSWYYDVNSTYRDLKLNTVQTLNNFNTLTDWMKDKRQWPYPF